MIDVGQGDCHIVGDIMIDAGRYLPGKHKIVPYLNKIGMRNIKHLFITHPHFDHYRGIKALIEDGITIENIYYSLPLISDALYLPGVFQRTIKRTGANLHQVGSDFILDSVTVVYVHDKQTERVNDYSMILKVKFGDKTILYPGDIGPDLDLSGIDLKADILAAPHHGMRIHPDNSFFDAVNPEFIMISAPEKLWKGTRVEQIVQWMEQNGVKFHVTGLHGDLTIHPLESLV